MLLKRIGQFFLDILEVVVFATAIFLFVYLLILQPHKIKGGSMEPNFHDKEYLLTDKVTYRIHEPKRGDVVVFKAPGNNGDEYIKRIIALPGEKLTLLSGYIYINGIKLEENYLPDFYRTYPIGNYIKEGQDVYIPVNQYLLMGDNRAYSYDSRSWGLIEKEKITGKAWFIYWPINRLGTVKAVEYNN